MASAVPSRLLAAVLAAVMFLVGLASRAPADQPAPQLLVFSAHADPRAGVRSVYKVAASDPHAEASVVMVFKTGTGDLVDVCRSRYLVAADYDALVVYRSLEDTLTRFALPTPVGEIQQIGDGTVVSLPFGRPRHANQLTLLHVTDDPWIENKRFLPAEPRELAKWSHVDKGAVSPDLQQAVFYLYPAAGAGDQTGPDASKPGASLVLVELETGERSTIALTRYPEPPAWMGRGPQPTLAWLNDHRIVYTSDPFPGEAGVPERWKRTLPPINLVVDLETGESVPFTGQEETALRAQRSARDRTRLARGIKLNQVTGEPGVIYDATTGKEIFRTPTKLSYPIASPDGSMLATSAPTEEGSRVRDLYIIELGTGQAHRVFRGYDLGQIFWMK